MGVIGEECKGQHRFFVAETVAVPKEGRVAVILACTACGQPLLHFFQVSEPGQDALSPL